MNPLERIYLDALESDPRSHEAPPRGPLLGRARSRRRAATATTPWAAPYAGRVAAMDAVLAAATDADWSRPVVEGWNLQELVAHLAAKDGLVASDVGAPVLGPPVTVRDPMGRTAEVQAAESDRSPEQTRQTWRAQADALCAHLTKVDPNVRTAPDGLSIPVREAMLVRGLETWIHADDAAQTSGLRMPPPVAEHLHPMADLCARLLPWTLPAVGADGDGRTVRVTLTGEGGGTWLVPLTIGDAQGVRETMRETADATIEADVVAFCFLVGGRREPETFPAVIEGDTGLARTVLRAAPAFSGP